jgi:hypothetical protein
VIGSEKRYPKTHISTNQLFLWWLSLNIHQVHKQPRSVYRNIYRKYGLYNYMLIFFYQFYQINFIKFKINVDINIVGNKIKKNFFKKNDKKKCVRVSASKLFMYYPDTKILMRWARIIYLKRGRKLVQWLLRYVCDKKLAKNRKEKVVWISKTSNQYFICLETLKVYTLYWKLNFSIVEFNETINSEEHEKS